MSQPAALPDEASLAIPSPPNADTRLTGTRLLLARGVWIVLMLVFCGFYLAALLVYAVQLHGFQTGVYAHLISTHAVVNGYDAFEFSYPLLTDPYATFNIALLTLVMPPLWIAISLLIFWRRSDDWMALFVSLFLTMLVTIFSPALSVLSYVVGFTSPLGICITLLQLVAMSSAGFFFVLFPDGRFVPGWTRWLTLAYLLLQVFFCLPSTSPYSLVRWPSVLLFPLLLGIAFAWGFAQLYRYRRVSTAIQRQQTKWIVFGMLVSMFLDTSNVLLPLVLPGSAHTVFIILSEVTFPFFLILLSLSVLGLSLLVVVGLGTLFSASRNLLLSLFASGLVAILFQPLRQRLQQAVNHLMFGERDEPYRVLSRLGSRLEATLAPESFLPTIVETVAQALKLPYVAITFKQLGEHVLAASFGEPHAQETLAHVPLVAQGKQVGSLLLAPRTPRDSLTPADLQLLHDLAPQIAVAVQAVRLTAELKQLTHDLQLSRTRLVTTREEERRRLRRDLHDGLGPTLASITFKIDAARNLLKQDSERVDRLLEGVRGQTQETLAQIRRLVYNLRPPALDELGLLSALREQAASYQHQGLQILIQAPECLPPLPAAVEVAAYRIVMEALTNAVRHAEAQQCLLTLSLHDHVLNLQISDDGKGIPDAHRAGVGLLAMQERANELGGSCTITRGDSGGTTIQVSLPLDMAEEASPTSASDVAQEQSS